MRIAISGTGRVGAWLARELSRDNIIAIYDEDRRKTGAFENLTVLPRPCGLKDFKPELFINAASLPNTVLAFKEAEPYLQESCIICDVASIKAAISDHYKESLFRFVSIHPMFGPTFAKMDSLQEENIVIIDESDREGTEFFRRFSKALGLRIFECSFQQHDKMMAYSLALPFISSLVFTGCVTGPQTVPGTTFRKHMAVAKGLLSEDDSLLAEILFNPYSIEELEKVTSRLEFLKHIIKAKDHEELAYFLEKSRENLLREDDPCL